MTRIFTLAAAACLISQATLAHAFPQRTSPPSNSNLPSAPPKVTINAFDLLHLKHRGRVPMRFGVYVLRIE